MTEWCDKHKEWATISLRLLLAFIFIPAGWGKLMNIAGTTGFFGSLGIPLAGFFAVVVGLVELLGGIAVLIGLATRYASALLSIIMVVALLTAHFDGGQFVNYGKAAVSLLVALSLMFSGEGVLGLERVICKKKK